MKTLEFAHGDRMPIIGLGTWESTDRVVYQVVNDALRIGYRHIDCAAIYGNESGVRQALTDSFPEIAALDKHHRYISGTFWAVAGGPYTLANIWDE